ncbi:DUF6139 family protein [Herbaspirillum huttiense]|jgi:hypothetical protein|uniref:DUF6139 family protein n=1 Tax=Herbaspirillum TaxID=963 RepID=UPI00040E9B37|nr:MULTISPECIES: DUF6139 family protein [Herbaspirillum]MAF03721.1 hypothetical protein [Herbaspirillum sp.]MBN9355412.1 hypothetical protein [Herbaspirillum huttiense]MBO16923.1 hypothetical protein [Herbaspirillum sp.]MBP1313831.1 hypothetical protein [Herbaspirillum sp. 1130]MCO4856157.1 DUF6139 family protein [Herbaspirillum sp. WGmk3]|tara:strand:+ start:1725 stop:1973 length:249 start_codon:yes stop_codon:yes gene_type:complete
MKVDVYKRPDGDGLFSYLVLPHEKPMPEEVTNTDWQLHEQNVDFERDGKRHFTLEPEDAFMQIGEKGYAITHLDQRSGDGAA